MKTTGFKWLPGIQVDNSARYWEAAAVVYN